MRTRHRRCVSSRTCSAASGSAAFTVAVAPNSRAVASFAVVHVDGDDVLGLEHASREQRREADAAETDHGDRRAARHRRGVDHGAHAGDHRAAEERGFRERQVGGHAHQRIGGEHRVIGESRDAEVVVDLALGVVQAARAREQRAGAVRGESRLAERRTARVAGAAVSAARHERGDDVVARCEAGHAGADFLHDARGFVPERHRQRPRPVAVDHRQVGVAESRRADPHQHLAGPGRVEFQLLDDERARLRIRRRPADFTQHRGFDSHARKDSPALGARRRTPRTLCASGEGKPRRDTPQVRPCRLARGILPRDGLAELPVRLRCAVFHLAARSRLMSARASTARNGGAGRA